MPPGTPQNQKSTGHADFGPTSTYRGRRSFAPGGTLGAFGDAAGDTADGRKSCARMSVMPSSHRAAALMTGAPLPVSFSEHQATKAENNRLRQQLEQANEKLDDERNLRQKKEDESIAFSRKLADATQRLTKTQRAAGRAERRQKRDEDEKAKGEEQMKYTIDELQEQMKGIADDKELQNAQLAELSKRVADKERTVVAMKNELASFQSDNDELKQANEGLETKLHSAVTELSDTSAKLDQAEGNNSSLRATMQDYRAEGDAHLKEMNDRITNLTLELEDKTDENTELHTQLEEVTKAKASLQSDLTVSETHHTDAASSLEKVNRTYVDLVAEHSKLQAKWEIAEAKMEELESDIADKGNHLGQKTDAVAKLKEEVTTLKQTVNEVSSQIRMRDDDIRELQSQKEALETQLEDQIKDNTVLAGKLEGERSRDHQARKDNVAETTKLLKEAEEAKEATREQKRRVTSLEKQVKKLKAEVEDASRENDNAVKESDELEEKVADLDYKVKIEMHNAKRQTLIAETLRKKLEQKETDIKSLRKSKKTLIDTANERLDKMNAETKKLEGIANQYRTEYELLSARFDRYRARRYSAASLYHDAAADGVVNNDVTLREEVSDTHEGRRSDPVRRDAPVQSLEEDDDADVDMSVAVSSVISDCLLTNAKTPLPIKAPVVPEESPEQITTERAKRNRETMEEGNSTAPRDMDVKALRAMAKDMGLKHTGTKKELLHRIETEGAVEA